MAIQKIKFTSDSVKETEIKLNQNFSEIELAFDGKQDVMQYDAMPTASATYAGKIAQYVGATAGDYTNGYFYKCVLDGSNYVWQQVSVQPASTVTLNGTPTSAAAFYAPLNGGTEGKVLKAHGNGQAPTWEDSVDVDTGATSIETVGAGNAVTTASYDDATRKITLTKGDTFVKTSDVDSTLDVTSENPVQNKKIAELVPAQASASNQLADKNFVNSSIATATATYRGNYNQVSDLNLTVSATYAQVATALATAISTADNNDYCWVQVPTSDATPTQIARVDRYKYDGSAWSYEYSLNNSGFTAAQWAAINSGITDTLVTKLNGIEAGAQVNTVDSVNGQTGAVVLDADDISDSGTTNKFVTAAEKTAWNAKQDGKTVYTFTASDAGWSAVDTDGFYTLTIPSTKTPFICFNASGAQVLAGLSHDGTNIYVTTDTKFAGSVEAF